MGKRWIGAPHREVPSRLIHRCNLLDLGKAQVQQHSIGRSTVPDSGEVLTHYHHIRRKIDTAHTQSKTVMVAYLRGVQPSLWILASYIYIAKISRETYI